MFFMGMTLKAASDSDSTREQIAVYLAQRGFSGYFKTDVRDVVAGPRRMIVVKGSKETIAEAKKTLLCSPYAGNVDLDFAEMVIRER